MPTPPNYEADATLAQTLPELSAALASGALTSRDLTAAYLARIEAVDRAGPRLQSIIALNPNALTQAEASDARRAAGQALGPLDGIPILLKDNIETLDPVPTTAGSLALKDNLTGRDSPLAAGLRAQGAVILGKTNLSQWANFRSNNSISGWSSVGGQVRNPHMLDRSPCGSSSGTGAAIAASLAAAGVGTETNGSIICPANVNGLVGFKPTVGRIPQQGIVPISPSQDTAGPMTKTVTGAALLMDAMDAGETGYAAALSTEALKGKRIGVLRAVVGSNQDIITRFNGSVSILRSLGAEIVEIEKYSVPGDFWAATLLVLQYEFKDSLNTYLAAAPPAVKTRTLADVIAFNIEHADTELSLFNQDLFEASDALGPLTDEAYTNALAIVQNATRAEGIDRLLTEYSLDAIVAPSGPLAPRVDPINGDVWPEWAGAGFLAAVSGYPHLTVPMGEVHGVPLGFSFLGGRDTDAAILAYGYAYEQATRLRPDPKYLQTAEDRPEIAAATLR
ncbi:amidase family protein [Hyphomonas neptunium ATCC 15444]|uniref:Amidase family protein n=1 Tax=Hyphomonas neptunium (strain ATCC 15444) TaxID=228405 RepID=Q0C2V5_HYPNA|nr:amidase family protein [Hyphomonas neptunium ATCC 15444]